MDWYETQKHIWELTEEMDGLRKDKELPRWIWAEERQPPDDWPRPVIVAEPYGWLWVSLRYHSGQWWAQGQFLEEAVQPSKVKYWMEVYPLPNGMGPQEAGGVGAQTGDETSEEGR